MGKALGKIRSITVRKDCGQSLQAPSAVAAQSIERIASPAVPPPTGQMAGTALGFGGSVNDARQSYATPNEKVSCPNSQFEVRNRAWVSQ